jgi:hypothetical protein
MKDSTSSDLSEQCRFNLVVHPIFSKFFGSDDDDGFEMPCH